MEIEVIRDVLDKDFTAGRLSVDHVPSCFTLEPPIGDSGEGCAIPEGRYPIIMAWSNRFKTRLAHVQNVPDRSAIEIHDGNHVNDTSGCILVGEDRLAPDNIGHSDLARLRLQHQIGTAIANGEPIWLSISSHVAS